jgi:FolB domain-containing protein
MDKILIKDLVINGIIGINPVERTQKQDILVNIEIFTDISKAADSDSIHDCINYRSVTKQIIAHVEQVQRFTVEALAGDIARICLENKQAIAVHVSVEKPGAVKYARSVGVDIYREQPT